METTTYNTERARTNMLAQQLRTNGVLEQNILAAIAEIPRETFVPEAYRDLAYADARIPLGHGQEMLLPEEQGAIIQALSLKPDDQVCEIGTGTGYLTALLALQAKHVISFELFLDFTETAQRHLADLNLTNVNIINDDVNLHWDRSAPYDVICITASLPLFPEAMKKGLAIGGRLFAIIGSGEVMKATLITRTGENTWQEQTLFDTKVPALINAPAPEPFTF